MMSRTQGIVPNGQTHVVVASHAASDDAGATKRHQLAMLLDALYGVAVRRIRDASPQ